MKFCSKNIIKSLLIMSFLCIVVVSSFSARADNSTVAVIDFSNDTGRYLPRIGSSAGETLTTLFVGQTNFRVVEREKLSALMTEQELSASGLVDRNETAVEFGRLLGAEYIVTGSLNNLNLEESSFSGYGITTTKVEATLQANIKLIDVTTGEILIANIYAESETFQDETKYSLDVPGAARNLIRNILDDFIQDVVNEMEPKEEDIRKEIMVQIISEPDNASVEIDGFYMGSTPLELPVEEGNRTVKISKGGYEDWEKNVRVYEGLEINVSLGLKQTDNEEDE